MSKGKDKNKKIIVGIVAVAVLLLAGGGYAYSQRKPSAEQVFNSYLKANLKQLKSATSESYSGTGTVGTAKGALDTTMKKYDASADLSCTGKVADNEIKFSSTFQIENSTTYMKVNSISGDISTDDGSTLSLQPAFAKIVGTWYKLVESDPEQKAQLDSGVFIFNNGVIAPSYNADEAVKVFKELKVFTYTLSSKDSDTYTYRVTANKQAYLAAIKKLYPNLSSPDLIMDGIFDDKSTRESTLVLKADGTLLKESLSQENICKTFLDSLLGQEVQDLPKEIFGESIPQPIGSVVIAPVTSSKDYKNMSEDLVR